MQIPENIREEYYRRLNGFANVSCREDTGAKMIENIINRKVDVVIDPVMLLGIDEWERIATQVEEKDYILVYTISDSDRVKQLARKVSAMTGKKIIVLGDKINGYGVNVKFKNGNGPQEFVSYIKNADCVITNSFHGTVFSVLFHKTIWIDNLNVQAGNARLNSLMSMLSIEDFSMKDLVEKDKLTTNDIWNEREWAHVDTMIEAKRKEADDFLERFIAKNKGGIV